MHNAVYLSIYSPQGFFEYLLAPLVHHLLLVLGGILGWIQGAHLVLLDLHLGFLSEILPVIHLILI
jgi:hypothetical protein